MHRNTQNLTLATKTQGLVSMEKSSKIMNIKSLMVHGVMVVILFFGLNVQANECEKAFPQWKTLIKQHNYKELEKLYEKANLTCQFHQARALGYKIAVNYFKFLYEGGKLNVVPEKALSQSNIEENVNKIRQFSDLWRVSKVLGDLYFYQKKYDSALVEYGRALKVISNIKDIKKKVGQGNVKALALKYEMTLNILENPIQNLQTFKSTGGTVRVQTRLKSIGLRPTAMPIHFPFNKFAIESLNRSQLPFLDHMVTVLENENAQSITIEGHTDDNGDPDYNLELSRKRAETIKNYLIKKGVSIPIKTVWYGESQLYPIDRQKERLSKEQYDQLCRRVAWTYEK